MYTSASRGAVPIAGFALSELAEIRQQFAGICEEGAGHLLWQHCMLSIAAALASLHAGPSWTISRPSNRMVTTLRTSEIVVFFQPLGNRRKFDLLMSSFISLWLGC
jgi:hypothetical protein